MNAGQVQIAREAPRDGNRSGRSAIRQPGFTLVELLVALGIIAVLTGVGVPVYQRVVQGSRAAACVSNLRQLGVALNLYLGEHNMVMPTMKAGRTTLDEEAPVIDNTLNTYAGSPRVFACPADTSGLAVKSGTSYYWNVALNGQAVATLNFLHLNGGPALIPILSDKQAFHPYTDTKVNILYADGHAAKDFNFVTSTPTPAP